MLISGTNAISYIFLIEMTFVNGHTQTWSVYINMLTGIVVCRNMFTKSFFKYF